MTKLPKFLTTNLIGLTALFFALGGTAVAARGLITGSDIAQGTITGGNVAGDTLTGANINEPTLGKVPGATNSDQLGGLPASSYLSGYQIVTGAAQSIVPGSGLAAQADCPPGKYVLGGGYVAQTYTVPLDVAGEWPVTPHRWEVDATNLDPTNTVHLAAYVICANVSP